MISSNTVVQPGKSSSFFLALGCVGFLSSPALASAGDQSDVQQRTDQAITVTGTRDTPELESPKATSDLLDTPQTVTVISDQTIRRQNLLTLRDALATVPGITFGAGEGAGGYGDSINLRGYSASNDVTQDGVRDSAQYSRTDPFNLQQIEVYNGANSVFGGSGSVGGTINLVSKVPQPADLYIVQGAIGTDRLLPRRRRHQPARQRSDRGQVNAMTTATTCRDAMSRNIGAGASGGHLRSTPRPASRCLCPPGRQHADLLSPFSAAGQ